MSFLDNQNFFMRWEDPQGNLSVGIRRDGAIVFPDGSWHNSGVDYAFQVIPSDTAIVISDVDEITAIITKTSQAHITCPAPVAGGEFASPAGQDGVFLRICSSTAYAHQVTFPTGTLICATGAKTILTMVPGGAALSATMIAYNGNWYLVSLTGGSVS